MSKKCFIFKGKDNERDFKAELEKIAELSNTDLGGKSLGESFRNLLGLPMSSARLNRAMIQDLHDRIVELESKEK